MPGRAGAHRSKAQQAVMSRKDEEQRGHGCEHGGDQSPEISATVGNGAPTERDSGGNQGEDRHALVGRQRPVAGTVGHLSDSGEE
jgi:hypothetical protein